MNLKQNKHLKMIPTLNITKLLKINAKQEMVKADEEDKREEHYI